MKAGAWVAAIVAVMVLFWLQDAHAQKPSILSQFVFPPTQHVNVSGSFTFRPIVQPPRLPIIPGVHNYAAQALIFTRTDCPRKFGHICVIPVERSGQPR